MFALPTNLLIGVAAAAMLGLVALAGIGSRRIRRRNRARLTAPARRALVTFAAGNDPTNEDQLIALDAASWRSIEPTAVELLGPLRGDARVALVSLLERRGVGDRALRNLNRRGARPREQAAEALGNLGRTDAAPALVELLHDRSPRVRTAAVGALGRIGDPSSAGPLIDSIVGRRANEPQLVIHALMGIGPAAAPFLEARLDRARNGSRNSGAKNKELVRAAAAEALGLVGAVTSAARVGRTLRGDPSLEVRLRAAAALGRLGTRSALAPLIEAAEPGRSPALRAVAIRALGEIGTLSAAPALAALLGDPQDHVAHNAAYALVRLGPAGLAILQELADGTADADPAPDYAGTHTDRRDPFQARAVARAREALTIAAMEQLRTAAPATIPVEAWSDPAGIVVGSNAPGG